MGLGSYSKIPEQRMAGSVGQPGLQHDQGPSQHFLVTGVSHLSLALLCSSLPKAQALPLQCPGAQEINSLLELGRCLPSIEPVRGWGVSTAHRGRLAHSHMIPVNLGWWEPPFHLQHHLSVASPPRAEPKRKGEW